MSGDLLTKVIEQGGLFAVMIFGMWLVSRLGWWAGRRLLDPANGNHPGGVLVQWFKIHQEFLSGLAARDEAQNRTCERHVELMGQTHTNTTATVAATAKAATGIEQLMDGTVHFNHSLIDLARVELLKMNIKSGMSTGEAESIRAQIEHLLQTVEARHQAIIARLGVERTAPVPVPV